MKKIIAKVLLAILLLITFQPVDANAASISNKSQTIQAAKETTSDRKNNVSWPAGPSSKSLSADSAIVMDADTGLILYSKNMDKKHYPASITKILTTLLCIENSSLDEDVTFKESEVLNLEYGASNIGTQPGEVLTMEQCLYAIMMESANEVCLGVADHISGTISDFATLMNNRAKELGCKNTHFTNPNGLHDDDHYTTAYDMALISREALQNDIFRKVTSTKTMYLPKTNKSKKRFIRNHHNMLHSYTTSQYVYEDCVGGKTGFTSAAQCTLVTFAERNGMTLICVVMRATSPKQSTTKNEYTDTAKLLDFGFENYEAHNLAAASATADDEEAPLFTSFNTMFDKTTAPLQMSNNGKIVLPVGVNVGKADQNITFYDAPQTEEEQQVIGTVSYTYGNKNVGTTNIYFTPDENREELTTSEDINFTESTHIAGQTNYKTTIILRIVLAVVVILLIAFLIFFFFILKRRKELSDRRNNYIGGRKKRKDLHF